MIMHKALVFYNFGITYLRKETILSTFLGITQESSMGDSFCDIINRV